MSGILSNLKNLKQRNVNAPPCFLIIDMVTIVQLKRLTEASIRKLGRMPRSIPEISSVAASYEKP